MTRVKKDTQNVDKPKEKYRVTNWKAYKFENQKTEAHIKCAIINKFNGLGMPVSVKVA